MIVIASVLIIVSSADNRYKNKKVTFTEYTVDENIHGTASIYACDLDSDGDMEILGASVEEDAIVYWRNDGGEPIKWTKQLIDKEFKQAISVYAIDLDGDKDLDVVGAAYGGSEIAIWLNQDSNPIKWKKQIIKSGFTFAHEVYACDLDLDGDNDILAASTRLNRLSWWRNDGGNPITIVWIEQVIDSSFIKAKSIRVADFDQDGDMDIVGAALDGNEIAWWENKRGNPIKWKKHLIDSSFMGAHRVQAVDMDNDGDIDILGAAYYGNIIAWWENKGGTPIVWQKNIIGENFKRACIVQAVDLDKDGDLDVAGSAQESNEVSWWHNVDGRGKVWQKFLVDSLKRVWPLYVCDLDNDGDNDIIAGSGSRGNNKVKLWINQLIK